MYFKVALIFILGIFFSGCSFNKMLKPKTPSQEGNITNIVDDNSTIIPLESNEIVEKKHNKYNLKPEPFSLENNEDDPELLGPQSTLDNGLNKDDIEEDIEKESKKPIKNAKKSTTTVKKEEKI